MKSIRICWGLGLLLLTAFGIPPVTAETNLIQDGGFELDLVQPGDFKLGLGAYGAWTSPTPGDCAGSTEILGLPLPKVLGTLSENVLPAYEGEAAINLGPCFGDGSVSQSFTTTVGAEYNVSLAVIGGTVTVTIFNADKTDLSADFVALERNAWGTDSYNFTATHTDTIILIQNTSAKTSTCCAPTIDDVRIVSIVTKL